MPTILLLCTAFAADLELHVVDGDDEPVSTARVRFAAEGTEEHPVAHPSGAWRGDALWTPDGAQVPLQPRDTVELEVVAAGYAPYRTTVELRRHTELVVRLDPLVLPADADPRARDALSAWQAAERAYMADPEVTTREAVYRARSETEAAAVAWIGLGGAAVARALCLSATFDPTTCQR